METLYFTVSMKALSLQARRCPTGLCHTDQLSSSVAKVREASTVSAKICIIILSDIHTCGNGQRCGLRRKHFIKTIIVSSRKKEKDLSKVSRATFYLVFYVSPGSSVNHSGQ